VPRQTKSLGYDAFVSIFVSLLQSNRMPAAILPPLPLVFLKLRDRSLVSVIFAFGTNKLLPVNVG